MENTETLNLITGGLAAIILLGAFLMMFTNFWTDSNSRKK